MKVQLFKHIPLVTPDGEVIRNDYNRIMYVSVSDGEGVFQQWTETHHEEGASTTNAIVLLENGKVDLYPYDCIIFGPPSEHSAVACKDYAVELNSNTIKRDLYRYGPNGCAEKWLHNSWAMIDISNADLYRLNKYKDITK